MNRLFLGLCMAGIASTANADINDDLQKLSTDAAKGYLGPVVSTMGANLNQGWFFEAPKPEFWGINVGIHPVMMGTFFESKDETFSTSSTTQIDEFTAELVAEQMVPANAPGREAAV